MSKIIYLSVLLAGSALSCAPQVHRDAEASAKRLALGEEYYQKRLVAPALVELGRALALDPENAEAYYMMGVLKMGQAVEHLELAERATCLRGAAADAERIDATGRMDEAERNFKLAVHFRPTYCEAYDGLAVVSIYRKDFEAAVVYERQAQENAVFAENVIAKGNLGWAYYGKKDMVRAEKELREAVSKAPKFCVGRYRLGQVLFDEGSFEAAAEQLGQVAELKCPIQEAYRLLGLAQQRLHDRTEAQKAFETCAQLAPKSCMAEECRKYHDIMTERD